MKRLISLLIAMIMIFSLAACGKSNASSDRDDNSTDSSDTSSSISQSDFFEVYERFNELVGYWNAPDGNFIIADMEDSHTAYLCIGMWDTEYFTGYSIVTDLSFSSEEELTAVVTWDNNENDVVIDCSQLLENNRLRVRIGQGDWVQYVYAGAIEVQAYQHYLNSMQGNDVGSQPDASAEFDFFELYERFGRLVGYWNASENDFAILDMEDSHTACFAYGMYETEFCTDYGRINNLTASGEDAFTALVTWTNEEQELIIDYSGLERDGKIRIKLGNGEWKQYTYAGATFDEAYQTFCDNMYDSSSENTSKLDFFELYERFGRLVGYWNASENDFAILDMEDSHTACFAYGMYETEFCTDYGRINNLTASGEDAFTALVTWTNEEQELIIDYSGLERDGKIRIKLGNGEWKQYTYAGATFDEAYQTFCNNMYGT